MNALYSSYFSILVIWHTSTVLFMSMLTNAMTEGSIHLNHDMNNEMNHSVHNSNNFDNKSITSTMNTQTSNNPHKHHQMTNSNNNHNMEMHSGITETIVFPQWTTNNLANFIGSCIGITLIAVLHEFLKYLREKSMKLKFYSKSKMLSLGHLIQTFLYLGQFAIAYFLMLSVMTYNYWIFLCILIGIALGYFLFGADRSFLDLNDDDCH